MSTATISIADEDRWTSTATKSRPDKLRPISVANLQRSHPTMRPPVVHGLLRVGETANIIAPPKVGKSFLAGNLAWCVATGRPWLSHDVEQGKVLILDNELHRETLASRLTHMADEMQVSLIDRDQVDVISLRGRLTSTDELELVTDIEPGEYRLIIVDALYRLLPKGVSENDNAQMMSVYNRLDQLADRWQAAIVIVHHSSKGGQGDKALTDMGAGAGAISRAADVHLAIRHHATDGHFVLEAVTRSFKSPEPVSIAFEWPIWRATTLTPDVKRLGRQNQEKQAKEDTESRAAILKKIPEDPKYIQQKTLRQQFEFGVGKFDRLVGGLVQSKAIKISRKRVGKLHHVYYSKLQNDSGNDSGKMTCGI